jgi:hypothetical protein
MHDLGIIIKKNIDVVREREFKMPFTKRFVEGLRKNIQAEKYQEFQISRKENQLIDWMERRDK